MDSRAEPRSARIPLVDVLRGFALAAMAVFHFFWDLEFFSFADLGVTEKPFWIAFAHATAGGFLALVGVSMVLAHGERLKMRAFARRLALLVAAAAVVTLASWFADPDGIILFGILHCIAISSVLGLAFLRLPLALVAVAAAAAVAAPALFTGPAFNAPGWLWLGLASEPKPSNDYAPLLPWFGMVLAGIALARLMLPRARKADWARWLPRAGLARGLAFAGRHSLIVYLVHQPLLLGVLWLVAAVILQK